MAIVYQYDTKGFYAGRCDDYNGPLPHNCVRVTPPALPWERVWPRWTGAAWELVEDHRARRVTDGFAPDLVQESTDYWLPAPLPEADDWQSPPRAMEEIGPLPRGAATQPPARPALTPAEAKAVQLAAINEQTQAAILNGFDHEIQGEKLHFSYDCHDQQNFADMAHLCLQRQRDQVVQWKARRDNGESVCLELPADAFLELYMQGALRHKQAALAQGDRRKLALEAAQNPQSLKTGCSSEDTAQA